MTWCIVAQTLLVVCCSPAVVLAVHRPPGAPLGPIPQPMVHPTMKLTARTRRAGRHPCPTCPAACLHDAMAVRAGQHGVVQATGVIGMVPELSEPADDCRCSRLGSLQVPWHMCKQPRRPGATVCRGKLGTLGLTIEAVLCEV